MQNFFQKYGDQIRLHPVEIYIDNTSGKYFLPDDVILRSNTIIAASVMPPIFDQENEEYFSLNSYMTDRPFITPDAFYNASLTLMEGADQIIETMPLSTLALFPGDKNVCQIFTTDISPRQSFIGIAAPTTSGRVATGESVVLNFYYLLGKTAI